MTGFLPYNVIIPVMIIRICRNDVLTISHRTALRLYDVINIKPLVASLRQMRIIIFQLCRDLSKTTCLASLSWKISSTVYF